MASASRSRRPSSECSMEDICRSPKPSGQLPHTSSRVTLRSKVPEAASVTVETPLRSETARDDPGMLTGSERTGWILRLLRSRSSVSKSKSGCGVSLGPCDCNTEELVDMTVVWPEVWMVLKWNCGPIHRRLWGPVCVTISTWESHSSSSCPLWSEAKLS